MCEQEISKTFRYLCTNPYFKRTHLTVDTIRCKSSCNIKFLCEEQCNTKEKKIYFFWLNEKYIWKLAQPYEAKRNAYKPYLPSSQIFFFHFTWSFYNIFVAAKYLTCKFSFVKMRKITSISLFFQTLYTSTYKHDTSNMYQGVWSFGMLQKRSLM